MCKNSTMDSYRPEWAKNLIGTFAFTFPLRAAQESRSTACVVGESGRERENEAGKIRAVASCASMILCGSSPFASWSFSSPLAVDDGAPVHTVPSGSRR
jgi:hypothetical protein